MVRGLDSGPRSGSDSSPGRKYCAEQDTSLTVPLFTHDRAASIGTGESLSQRSSNTPR